MGLVQEHLDVGDPEQVKLFDEAMGTRDDEERVNKFLRILSNYLAQAKGSGSATAQNERLLEDLETAIFLLHRVQESGSPNQIVADQITRLERRWPSLNGEGSFGKLKAQLDKQYETKYGGVKAENAKLMDELAQIKAQRKDIKKQFKKSNKKFDEFLAQINQRQAEQQLLMEVVSFKTNEKQKVDSDNDLTRAEIDTLTEDLKQMREEFEDLSKLLSEAEEKKTRVETLVNMNNEDPRCKMENVPPEMAQLLDSLNAVNQKLE